MSWLVWLPWARGWRIHLTSSIEQSIPWGERRQLRACSLGVVLPLGAWLLGLAIKDPSWKICGVCQGGSRRVAGGLTGSATMGWLVPSFHPQRLPSWHFGASAAHLSLSFAARTRGKGNQSPPPRELGAAGYIGNFCFARPETGYCLTDRRRRRKVVYPPFAGGGEIRSATMDILHPSSWQSGWRAPSPRGLRAETTN